MVGQASIPVSPKRKYSRVFYNDKGDESTTTHPCPLSKKRGALAPLELPNVL